MSSGTAAQSDHAVTGLPSGHVQPPPPQPLILDPKLRFPIESRILLAWKASEESGDKMAKRPWIICGDDVPASRVDQVESAGARVIRHSLDRDGTVLCQHN